MKRIIILVLIVLCAQLAKAQGYRTAMGIDTFNVPSALHAYTFITTKGDSTYYWSISQQKWVLLGVTNNYATGVDYSGDVLTIHRQGLSDITAALPFSSKLDASDSTRWVTTVLRRGDSVFVKKGGLEYFAYIDSSGSGITAISTATDVDTTGIADGDVLVWDSTAGKYKPGQAAGGADSSVYSTHTYVDSVINTLSVAVDNAGTGENILFDRNDTIYGKRITGDGMVSTSTSSDSTIHIAVDLSSYPTRTELQDTAGAIRANMGSGSGVSLAGTYGPGGGAVMWVDTTINRIAYQVGSVIFHVPITDSIDGTSYDVDAQAYIDDVNATDVTLTITQKQAINDYVLGLKSDGLWSLIYDQGLPVWGTAASSAIMLKGTHTTTWVNSPTFSSNGVTGNGTSSYGNLNFTPATAYSSQDNAHLAVYVHDNQTNTAYCDIGTYGADGGIRINSKYNSAIYGLLNNSSTSSIQTIVSSSAGFSLLNRTSSSNVEFYKNGSLTSTSTTAPSTTPSAYNIYLLASNQVGSPGVYSARTISLWSIGGTLTSTQAGNLASRVNTLMTALGIQVY